MFKAILFDLDGTLIDTEPTAARTVELCFQDWGVTPDPDDARYVTGRTWKSALDFLFRKYRPAVLETVPREELFRMILIRYRQLLEQELPTVRGSVEAVRALSATLPLVVVSGSNHDDVAWALTKLGIRDCFRFILGAEDYPRSKPEPDGYRKAMDMLGIKPGEGLVFEDSLAGIASARAAGLWVVAISSTNHFSQDISGAHEEISDLTPVSPEWLTQLSTRIQSR